MARLLRLVLPQKAIRRVIRGKEAQKWHLVSSEGQVEGTIEHWRWWVCGCGESMGENELDPHNYANAHLRSLQVVGLEGLMVESEKELCQRCWQYPTLLEGSHESEPV